MVNSAKPIPEFADEAQERAYWESHDSSAHVDWRKAEKANFPNLKPSAKTPLFQGDVRRRKPP
jgi:CopG antitoxin of type II toxin-antitoxin system